MYNIIEEGVTIGKNCTMKHFIELRKGTVIGDNCYIDSKVSTSGDCIIGNNCTLRFNAIIARNVVIGNDVFIAPNVMFINIAFTEKEKKKTIIGDRVKIGTGSIINDSVHIVDDVIIGAMSFVRKDILEKGVYVGNPLRKIK